MLLGVCVDYLYVGGERDLISAVGVCVVYCLVRYWMIIVVFWSGMGLCEYVNMFYVFWGGIGE